MNSWFLLVYRALTGMARSSASLAADIAVLRDQIAFLHLEPRLGFGTGRGST